MTLRGKRSRRRCFIVTWTIFSRAIPRVCAILIFNYGRLAFFNWITNVRERKYFLRSFTRVACENAINIESTKGKRLSMLDHYMNLASSESYIQADKNQNLIFGKNKFEPKVNWRLK